VIKKLLVLFLVVFVWAKVGFALDINNLTLDNLHGQINVEFELDVPEIYLIRSALDDGKKINVELRISLLQTKSIFWDSILASKLIKIHLSKDMVQNTYILTMGKKKYLSKKIEKLLLNMKWIKVNLGPWKNIDSGKYKLKIETQVVTQDVPAWVKTILFFWNFNLSGPDTFTMEFNL